MGFKENVEKVMKILSEIEELMKTAREKGAGVLVVIVNEEPYFGDWFAGVCFAREWKKEWDKELLRGEDIAVVDPDTVECMEELNDIAEKIEKLYNKAFEEYDVDLGDDLHEIARKLGMRIVHTI